ncbi:YadA-like family protein [Phascolarctobacterium faecium]|uniref:YadA-like family protein n=1 Tax=Phascolarctobacterium faecium TaxID=33025 RepID=UPI000F0BEE76|nr:YadA-like family protein [Phascolarctobacterium faecium]BBG64672.1 Adhesin YadA precursor [Phascolarctobacterium faecium]
MSKREIRAKRLVAAVLLAISVQMWSAPPLWAAEASVQTETSAAGEAKETKDAKDAKAADSETGGEADADEGENVVVPVIGYSTRSAAGSDYGVMPLADMAVDGALTGVTGINGSELVVDKVNNNFFIGTIQDGGSFDKSSKNNAAIGLDIYVDSNGNSSVFGAAAKSWGESASVFGAGAESGEYGSVFGAGAEASEQYGSAFGAGALAGHSNTVAFGYSAKSTEWYSIAVGAEAKAEVTGGIAIGALANVGTGVKTYGSGIAIGMEAHTNNDLTIALGYNAESTFESSIAVGANSATTAAYQVAFGTGEVKTVDGAEVVTWTDRRSLAGISDIDMEGALTGVNKIDMKNGALTGVSTINGNVLVPMNEDVTNKSLAIGTGADFKNHYSSVTTIYKNAIAIGNGAYAGGNGSLAIGFDSNGNAASAGGVGSISLNAMASGDHNVIISGWADAYDSVVIGYGSSTDNSNVVAIGNGSYGGADGTVLGYAAGTDGRNSVAIGAKSSVASGDDDKVSFGHKVGDTNYADGSDYSDDLFRSLINVADIEMHGNISLGGEWSWNDAGTSYISNGLGNLTGVTGINGIEFFNYDCGDGPVLAIGSTIGNDSTANSVGLGINTIIEGYGSVAIGVSTNVRGNGATGVGSGVSADGENSVAVGSNAFATADGATAVGSASRVYAEGGSALGYATYVAAAHTNSVAIGAKSATGAANQVSFGHKVGDRNEYGGSNFTDDLFRSLVNVADIEMHGALTGVTGIDGVTVSGTDASTGLTVGGNAVIGKTDTPFSSTGFAVAKDGAVTAKTVNGAAITSNSFNGVTLEKGADSHYKVGGVDVTKMQTDVAGKADAATVSALDTRVGKSETDIGTLKTTVGDSSKGLVKDTADLKAAVGDSSKGLVKQVSDVDTAYKAADTVLQGRAKTLEDKTAGISRSGSTTTLETNTSVSSSGITTNKATVSGATATTLENGKLTVGAATVQNTGFAVGSSSLNNGSLTVDGNNKLTTAGLTASKVTVGTVTVSGGKVSGLTDAALSAVSTEAVTGKQLNATNTTVAGKADKATTLTGYGITDAYTKTETTAAIDTAKTELTTAIGKKADAATTLTGYGITDAYTKTAADEKITAATADMATKTQVTADIGTAKTALESAYQAADNALSGRATALETKTAKFNTAGDNLTGMANITSTAATLGGVGFASAGVMTGVASIDGIAIDASRNLSKAGTYNGVTVAAAGISGTSVFNGAAITNNSFNGVTLEKGADNHYKVGGVDVSALKTTVDSISADGVGTADTAGIKRDTTGTATTTIETNTSVSSSGITTNKATVSGATATTLENGKLTVGAATVQNTGFAVGSSSLNNGSLTVDGNNKLTTAGLTASKVTVGTVTVSGGKVSGLTDAALSAVSTEAVTGKQLNATNTTVSALDTAYKAADTQIRTDFAAADTTLQNNIDAKVAQAAYDTKMSALDSADTALGSRAAALETAVNDSTTGLAAVNAKVGALDTAYKAADTQIRTDFAAADTALKTELNTAIDEKAKKATDLAGYGITDAYTKTAADEKITAATADMATKTQVTADIGTAKTALESAYQAADTALSDRAAALETAATGMSYDAGKNTTTFTGGVTATVLTAGEFKVGATGFGFGNDGALTAKTVNGIEIKKDESKVMVGGIDLTALSNGDVVTDNTKGIGRNQDTATTTIETNTAISSSGITTNAVTASGTVKAGEFVEGSQKLSDKYAAKTALADYTTTTDMNTKFADYATTTAVDTKLADYAKSDSVYSKAAADTAFAKAGDVDTLKTTVGDADGGLVKDVTELQSGKADKATTLAGYGIADAYTQTEINEKIVEATKDLATSATVTDIQSGLDEVTGKTAGLSYDTASGSSKFSGSVVIGNEGAKTHTQITDDAIIFGEGTDKQVTVDASGIHVGKKAAGGIALYADADGTHIDHTSLVTGSVTADNLNGVAISGNATDGLSVGGVSIKALSERLDSLEQDGVATADMGGIKRTDVVENSGKTIIEDTTSFTKDGLKTANLEAATAAFGGVNFAAGAVTGVSSINGVVFGSDGKIGGVSLSGGTGGGGSSANTSGIHKPDRDTTNIEGNTSITTDGIDTNKVNASDSIVVADGEKNKTVISKDGILVAEGEKNQVKINEDGIHVGKNSSVVNDTDGFITDKGLYIGVSSSSDTSTAKFSVAPNGNLSSKAGDYGFSNTSADGAKFTHSGDTAYGTGSQLDTTIQGNKVTTGRIDTDELYVDGNKVTVAGGTIGQTDAVDNHLSGTDADGNTVTNDFKTSAVNGTTQAAEKTSADGKESTKTVNNTSAGGTSVTTSRTTTDSKDNVTVKESSFGTNEKGMTLSTSNKVTDKDGKVTKDTSGTTTMTGDSISVSKTTTTTEKDADGNEKEVTKTSGTTIGSGEVTLKREDGSTIEVGSAIEGMQSDMRELDGRVNRMGVEIKEVGALSAALAGLHPQPENANSRADFAMAMGSYEGKQALAVGGFYRPDKRTMLSIGASTTSSKHMMNMGISIALDRLPEAERKAKEAARAAGVEQETLNRVLERLAALEQDNRRLQADNEKRDVAYEKLAADYTQLKEKYIEETADRQQPEQAEAEE